MGLNSFIYGFRKVGRLSKQELKQFIITVIIFGIIIGFKDNRDNYGLDLYLAFFLIFSIVFSGISLLIKLLIQRSILYYWGFRPEYKYSINNLLIGLVLILASEGVLWFLAPGFTLHHLLQSERIGKWRYGLNYNEQGRALALGIFGLVFFTFILKFFVGMHELVIHAMNINIAITIYSIIPMPDNDGLHIFFSKRWLWVFTAVFVIISSLIAIFLTSPYLILIGGVLCGSILTILFNTTDLA